MAEAKSYPVTTPYGQVPGYPLNNGFHKGEDRAMPVGTPVKVNGVLIGYSGKTGFVTGPHLHVGKWLNGQHYNPNGKGFSFTSAVVTQVDNYDNDANGKFVRIQGDGFSWVYLHLNQAVATVGQKLVPPPTKQYLIVKAGEGLAALAKRTPYRDWWLPTRWQAITNLNGGGAWWTFNSRLQPGQRVRVR